MEWLKRGSRELFGAVMENNVSRCLNLVWSLLLHAPSTGGGCCGHLLIHEGETVSGQEEVAAADGAAAETQTHLQHAPIQF